jgi:hypothetical protein
MTRKTWYSLHKWLAVGVGIFILTWTISGIVMVLPSRWFGTPEPEEALVIPKYRNASVSPAQAVVALEKELNLSVDLSEITMRQVLDRVVYEISYPDGGAHLIDATSGELFRITPEVAEQIARRNHGGQAQIFSLERLNEHNLIYPFGPLPVYQVVFEDDRSAYYYVRVRNGAVERSTGLTRLRNLITSLHTFEPVKLISNRDTLRKGLLVITGLIAVGVGITGYVIFITPILNRRRWAARSEN